MRFMFLALVLHLICDLWLVNECLFLIYFKTTAIDLLCNRNMLAQFLITSFCSPFIWTPWVFFTLVSTVTFV